MNRIVSKLLVSFVGLVMAFSSTSALAMETAKEAVKVGYFLFDGYHMLDEDNGFKSGYGYEYLQSMRIYTGHEYDYIGDDEAFYWEDMIDMLEAGDIDLLTSVTKTEERMERIDFSDLPIGTKSSILIVSSRNELYYLDDYDNWDGIRVGMIENNSTNEFFEQFAKEHGFTYEIVYMDSSEDQASLLKNGSIDAFLSSDLNRITDEDRIIAKFNKNPFYACVTKGNDALLQEVNNAILSINNNTPYLEIELKEKYYSMENSNQIYFTAEEREFIAKAQENGTVFKALLNSDQEPYSHYQDGKFVGSNVEICKEIILRTGLNVEFIQSKTVQEYIESIETEEADILLDSIFGHNACERYGYIQLEPYYSAEVSSLTKKTTDNNKIEVVALVKTLDYRKSTDITQKYEYQEIIECNNTAESIQMVEDGDVDATYLFTIVAEQAVRNDPKNHMVTTGLPREPVEFSLAVHQDQNILLSSILSKASASIREEDIIAMSQPYLEIGLRPITVTSFIYANPIFFAILAGCTVAFLSMIALTIYVIKNKRRNELLNSQLSHALTMADKASVDKSRFLAQMSHEIRTPMNAIIGLTSIAQMEIHEQDKVKTYLNKISDSSRVLLRIINDILDMSAIEGGKMKIDNTPFDFKKLVFDVTTMFYQQTKQKNIEFSVQMGSVINEILIGDELRTQQILMNLLSNAGKFTNAGGKIELKIVETSQSQDRVYIRYKVVDTGCGMSQDMQLRLFKPFEQQDATTAKKYGGSGLGLSITKNLVDLMGGVIQVKSVEGEGSQFIVDVPYTRGANILPSTNDCFSKIRALVINSGESDSYISSLLKRLLVPHDFASNLDEAMDMLGEAEEEDDPYKLCLLDWNIPNINGVEFVQTLQEVFGKDGIIIMILAYDLEEIEMTTCMQKVKYFIPKPLFQSTLVDALMNIGGYSSKTTSKRDVNEVYDYTGKTVLIVEDVMLNKEVAVKLLELVNVNVVTAEDGLIAVEKYEQEPAGTYDCILMDINMPNMNGYEATRIIRAMNKLDSITIPIYAMTANAFSEDVKAALDSGMNGHIAKPIETKILYETLKKALYGGENE